MTVPAPLEATTIEDDIKSTCPDNQAQESAPLISCSTARQQEGSTPPSKQMCLELRGADDGDPELETLSERSDSESDAWASFVSFIALVVVQGGHVLAFRLSLKDGKYAAFSIVRCCLPEMLLLPQIRVQHCFCDFDHRGHQVCDVLDRT